MKVILTKLHPSRLSFKKQNGSKKGKYLLLKLTSQKEKVGVKYTAGFHRYIKI